jgi:hypothetical protein
MQKKKNGKIKKKKQSSSLAFPGIYYIVTFPFLLVFHLFSANFSHHFHSDSIQKLAVSFAITDYDCVRDFCCVLLCFLSSKFFYFLSNIGWERERSKERETDSENERFGTVSVLSLYHCVYTLGIFQSINFQQKMIF